MLLKGTALRGRRYVLPIDFNQKFANNNDIDGFFVLRYDEQKKIRQQIESSTAVVLLTKCKGKKHDADDLVLKDFGVEYSASGRAMCAGCQIKIPKDEVRIKKTVYDTEVGMKFGGQAKLEDAKLRTELRYLESGKKLPGFASLSKKRWKKGG